ncbi:MAG: hypothetical protein ACYDBY_15065 [Thermoanaerobaculia bacterium]
MLRKAAFVLASLAASGAFADGPRREASYVLAEGRTVVSPAGERASAVRGTVVVRDGTARWDLESGTFPRSTASTILLGQRDGWLLERDESVAARATPDDLASLWVPPPAGEEGPFRSVVRGLAIEPPTAASGPAFEGRPTKRHRLTAGWSLETSTPGRVSTARTRLVATVVVVEEIGDEVRSPLDGLERLLDLPGAVRQEVVTALGAISGWPVSVVVETESEQTSELPGVQVAPPEGRRPLKTRVEAVRTVSALVLRPAGESGPAFTLPERTRVVGIERIVAPREPLR